MEGEGGTKWNFKFLGSGYSYIAFRNICSYKSLNKGTALNQTKRHYPDSELINLMQA